MAVRKCLYVQFEIRDGDSFDDFLAVEETLFQAFEQNSFALVDGFDVGEGRFNIFIYPKKAWGPVVERVRAFLKLKGWLDRAIIAKHLPSGRLQVIWPEIFDGQFRL